MQDLHKGCRGKIFVNKIVIRGLRARSVGKIYVGNLLAFFFYKTSINVQGPYKTPRAKFFLRTLRGKISAQDLLDHQNEHHWTSHHNENDLTRPRRREGCANTSEFCKNIARSITHECWPRMKFQKKTWRFTMFYLIPTSLSWRSRNKYACHETWALRLLHGIIIMSKGFHN